MRVAVVGMVKSSEYALLGLLDKKANICGIFTSTISEAMPQSQMGKEYYGNLHFYAQKLGCPLTIVDDFNDHYQEVLKLKPDVVVVVGWPQIVRKQITDSFVCIGMHPALLPKRRGGAPLNWQIIDGVTQSAVSIIRLEEGVDSGDILVQIPFSINHDDYIGDVLKRVELLTRDAMAEAYSQLNSGTPKWIRQDDTVATYTRRRRPEDGLIHWNDSTVRIYNLVRAVSYPFPGAFSFLDGEVLKIWRAKIPLGYRARLSVVPGQILTVAEDAIIVSTRDNAIGLTKLEYRGTLYEGSNLYEFFHSSLNGKILGGNLE